MKSNFFWIVIFLLVVSCKKEKQETFDQGYDYYPLAINNYKIYDVHKISYSLSDTVDESYQIKELVTDTFIVASELKYRLERYKRLSDNLPWPSTPDSVWTASAYSGKIVKEESNVRYIKLVFPVTNGKTWNGNAENNLGEENYYYTKVGKNYSVQNRPYSNTSIVIQNLDTNNIIYRDYRFEVYSRGIGMIRKVKETYSYQQDAANLGKFLIDFGTVYYEELNSYGKQ